MEQFFSLDKEQNLFLWAMHTQPKHRREYPIVRTQAEYAHLRLIRFMHPRQAHEWLDSLQ